MSLTLALALYFIIWWTVLFAVLPFGVRTQEDAGEVVPGTPESAPAKLQLAKTALITTLVSFVVFALVHWLYVSPAARAAINSVLRRLTGLEFFPS